MFGKFELRILGVVDLRQRWGQEQRELLKQRKYTALLAYLAAETPRGFHARDRLVAMFWPELDQEHARGALRKAVHEIRRALGPDVLPSRGDDEVGVSDQHLWCDASAFEDEYDQGHLVEAMKLYRGDLLAGFYVNDAPDFLDWLDRARTRLRDRASAAAWSLAQQEEHAEHLTVAGGWGRRAAELAPTDERMLRRVLALLDRLGDRAGALFVYDRFAKQLKRDYGAEPSLDTKALVRQVRERGGSQPSDR
jgi:DNA-binding SARP family transcriptional activator